MFVNVAPRSCVLVDVFVQRVASETAPKSIHREREDGLLTRTTSLALAKAATPLASANCWTGRWWTSGSIWQQPMFHVAGAASQSILRVPSPDSATSLHHCQWPQPPVGLSTANLSPGVVPGPVPFGVSCFAAPCNNDKQPIKLQISLQGPDRGMHLTEVRSNRLAFDSGADRQPGQDEEARRGTLSAPRDLRNTISRLLSQQMSKDWLIFLAWAILAGGHSFCGFCCFFPPVLS